ncbi:MAG: dienelactone hydrolase family protein [Pararhodobacter sp.]|nr:dienelactone hydrolase family protein [Pararhodobacter sp.]
MARQLQSGRKGAAKGTATSAVIFVHGYGADGADLLGLADPLAPHLPQTAFFSPNAPERCTNNPMGFQWFPIPWLDGSSEEAARAGMAAAIDDLNGFVDQVLSDEGLAPEALALVGFSQGTMMSLHIAPRRAAPLAAVVGFSGRLLNPEALEAETISRPPVLLIHGDADEMVPVQSLPDAADALVKAGFETYAHVSKGVGHGIAPDGLSLALGFLRDKLPAQS